jgi:hypothetical protein
MRWLSRSAGRVGPVRLVARRLAHVRRAGGIRAQPDPRAHSGGPRRRAACWPAQEAVRRNSPTTTSRWQCAATGCSPGITMDANCRAGSASARSRADGQSQPALWLGYEPLRLAIASYLRIARDITCSAERFGDPIFRSSISGAKVGCGSNFAAHLLAREHVQGGQANLKEERCWRRANNSAMLTSFHQLCCWPQLPDTGQRSINNGSARTGARSVALTGEHLIRRHNRAARDAQFGCQSARRWQAGPGGEPPRQDFGANPLVNLAIDGDRAPR